MVFNWIGDGIMPSKLLHVLPHPLLSTLCRLILNLMLDFNAQVQLLLLPMLLPCTIYLHHLRLVLLDKSIFVVFLLLREGLLLSVQHQLLLQRTIGYALLKFLALLVLLLSFEEGLSSIEAAVDQVIEFFGALLIVISEERFVSAAKCLMRRRMAYLGKVEPGIAVFVLLILQGALKFIMVDRFECLAIVERRIS